MSSIGQTLPRKANLDVYFTSGEVVAATAWLVVYLLIVGASLLSGPLASAIEVAAR